MEIKIRKCSANSLCEIRIGKTGKSKVLFNPTDIGLFGLSVFGGLDNSPDGKRFSVIKEDEVTDDKFAEEVPLKINIIANWFEELRKRVPVD